MAFGDVAAALGVGLLVFVAGLLAFGAQDVKRLRKRLEPHVADAEGVSEKPSREGRRGVVSSVLAATERLLGGLGAWRSLETALARADASLGPAQFFYAMVASGLVPALLLVVAGVPVLVGVLLFLLGAFVPWLVLRVKAARRQREFDEQLPQVLMAMAASVRVGHSFRQAMQAIANDDHGPASKEFGRVLVELDLGRPVDEAFSDMAERLGSRQLRYVINAITIQREVGGSLAGLFDLVAETVRNRQQFAGKVRALTAMGRISAYILTALPFIAVAMLSAIDSTYTLPLFTTSSGRMLAVIALAGILIGGLILKKMVAFQLS